MASKNNPDGRGGSKIVMYCPQCNKEMKFTKLYSKASHGNMTVACECGFSESYTKGSGQYKQYVKK